MTVVTIPCPTCRTVDDIPAAAVFVDVDTETDDTEVAASLAWICGRCVELVSVPVAWAPLLAVMSAGAPVVESEDGELAPGELA